MANLFASSIGRKLVMSLSGLFLILFLFVHLLVNSFLLFGPGTAETGALFNAGVHFMGTNPMIKVVEPVLGLGFLIHIVYSLIISAQNARARGKDKYASGSKTKGVSSASKTMLPLGIAVFAFLVVHIANFWVKMKVTHDMPAETMFMYMGEMVEGENGYALVNAAFQNILIVLCYTVGSLALAHHLSHGFWSAFQTIGLNNTIWLPRLKVIGTVVAWVIGGGFTLIAWVQFLVY